MKLALITLLISFCFSIIAEQSTPFIESVVDKPFSCETGAGKHEVFNFRFREGLNKIRGIMRLDGSASTEGYSPAIFFALYEDADDDKYAYWLALVANPEETDVVDSVIRFYYRGTYHSPRIRQQYNLGEQVGFSIIFDSKKQLANTRISKRNKTLKVPFWSNPVKISFQCQNSKAQFMITDVHYSEES